MTTDFASFAAGARIIQNATLSFACMAGGGGNQQVVNILKVCITLKLLMVNLSGQKSKAFSLKEKTPYNSN